MLFLICTVRHSIAGDADSGGRPKVRKIADSIVDPSALNFPKGGFGTCPNGKSFQQDPVASHQGHQYVTYYDSERRLCVARRKLPDGKWENIHFEDYHIRGNDTHNGTVLGICPGDGTIHLAFDHHNSDLHYRISRKDVATQPDKFKWEASLFSETTWELEPGVKIRRLTYPRFFSTPGGKLQFWFRLGSSGNGDSHLFEYDPASGAWENLGLIISREGSYGERKHRCPYLNGLDYDVRGRLHATWCWRETGGVMTNHDINYAYSDDLGRTWFNNYGVKIREPADAEGQKHLYIYLDSPNVTVQNIGMNRGMVNNMTQAVDSQGRIHVLASHIPPDAPEQESQAACRELDKYFYYWREEGGKWNRVELPFCGDRPKMLMDTNDNTYLVFSGDPLTAEVEDDFQIAAATASSNWSDWKIIHLEKGPFTGGEPLLDRYRWRDEGILSVYIQEAPKQKGTPSPLHIIDFKPE